MSELEPITRKEVLLNAISEGTGSDLEPITREEMFLQIILMKCLRNCEQEG